MVAKIVGLDGEERTPPDQPIASVVEAAREILRMAESGDLRQIAAALINRQGGLQTAVRGEGSWMKLLGAVTMVQHDIYGSLNAIEPG